MDETHQVGASDPLTLQQALGNVLINGIVLGMVPGSICGAICGNVTGFFVRAERVGAVGIGVWIGLGVAAIRMS